MRARQIAEAHQKLVRDLAARKAERLLEQLHPFVFRQGMVGIEPGREGPVVRDQREDSLGVVDRRCHFEPVPDDPGISQKARDIVVSICGDGCDIEVGVGGAEGVPLLEDRFPRQACLIDFQDQPLEENVVVALREAVLGAVVGRMDRIARCKVAVGGHENQDTTGMRGLGSISLAEGTRALALATRRPHEGSAMRPGSERDYRLRFRYCRGAQAVCLYRRRVREG